MKPRLLAIDDELRWRDNFRAWIPDDMVVLDSASNTTEAVEFLRRFRYDAVLLDLAMDVNDPQNRDNRSIQAYLSTRPNGTVYVVVSANAEKAEVRDLAFRFNAFDVVFKAEIDPDLLSQTVQKAIAAAQLDPKRVVADARDMLLGDVSIEHAVLTALGPKGGVSGLYAALDPVLERLAPICAHVDRRTLTIRDRCVVGLLWSRQLGHAVSIVLFNEQTDTSVALETLSNWLGNEEGRGKAVVDRSSAGTRVLGFEEPSIADQNFALPVVAPPVDLRS